MEEHTNIRFVSLKREDIQQMKFILHFMHAVDKGLLAMDKNRRNDKELDCFLAPEDDHSELMLVTSLLRSLLPMKCVPTDSAPGVLTWPLIQCRDGLSPER